MITEIEFKRTSNIFINAGIVALYQYLKIFKEDNDIDYDYSYSLDKDSLQVKCDKLFTLLEDVYYYMGKELYDTVTEKQEDNLRNKKDCNAFYDVVNDQFVLFPKKNTYGLTHLITNNKSRNTLLEANQTKLESLPNDIKAKFLKFQEENNMKFGSIVYLNEEYTCVTRLEKPVDDYFKSGNQFCYVSGIGYKKLVPNANISPFIKQQGTKSFNSSLNKSDVKISWTTMYLYRFSPKLCLYFYNNKRRETINCYFFESTDLVKLNTLYERNKTVFKDSMLNKQTDYLANFRIYQFKRIRDSLSEPYDFKGKNETLFALIYTFYKQFLYDKGFEDINDVENIFDLGFEKIPISLISFKADSFSSTLRPNAFEYFNNFKFAIRLIIYLEKDGIKFSQLLSILKFMKNSERNSGNSYLLERKQREKVLTLMLNGKSVVNEIAQLYYQCYTYLLKGDPVGFKNYKQLLQFTSKYELKINKQMTPEMQEKALNLGSSIGLAIIRFDNPKNEDEKKANAKSGRKYIIDLNKSRTLDQFNDAIIRIMNKYQLQVNTELFKENLNEENFEMIKQFAIIGALNVINNVIKPINTTSNEKQ